MVTSNPKRALPVRLTMAAYLVVALAYVVVRIYAFSAGQNYEFPDSPSFLEKAASPLNADFFLDEGRFFSVPLFYKLANTLFGKGSTPLTIAQVTLSIAAWLTLAWSFARVLSVARVGLLGFVLVLGLSLHLDVTMWDRLILSESLTYSLFVLFLAVWLQIGEGLTNARAAMLFVVSAFYAFTREANGLILLPFGVLLVVWALWYLRDRRRQIICAAIAASWVAITVAGTVIAHAGERWVFPMLNVVGTRVLTNPTRLEFWKEHGMPVNERLLAMKGEMAGGQNFAFERDPALEDFRRWLKASGRETFSADLMANPTRSLWEPLQDFVELVCPTTGSYNTESKVPKVLPDLGFSYTCQPSGLNTAVVGSLILGSILLLAAVFLPRQFTPGTAFKMLTLSAMLLGWVPFVWFSWHVLGGMEISRHSLSGTYEYRIALVFLVGYVAMAISLMLGQGAAIDTRTAVTAD